jgi:molecular chaperone DnaK
MRLGEAIYKASQDDGADESPMDAANRDTDGADDDILDADFEDLGGDKR